MSVYSPGPGQPSTPEDIFRYLQGELNQISRAFASGQIVLQRQTEQPKDPGPQEHRVVFADGAGWDPGSGAGAYVWNGSAWAFLGG